MNVNGFDAASASVRELEDTRATVYRFRDLRRLNTYRAIVKVGRARDLVVITAMYGSGSAPDQEM